MVEPEDGGPLSLSGLQKIANEWLLAVLFAVVPFSIVVIRLCLFSRGDTQVLFALMSGVDLLSLLTVYLSALASSLAWTGPMVAVAWPRWFPNQSTRDRLAQGKPVPSLSRAIKYAIWATVLCVLFVPQNLFVLFYGLAIGWITLAYAAAIGEPRIRHRLPMTAHMKKYTFGHSPSPAERLAFIILAALLVFLMAIAEPTAPPLGRPVELLKIANENSLSAGYVVAVDDTALTLAYTTGGIRYVPTDQVQERYLCPPGSPALNRLPVDGVAQPLLSYRLAKAFDTTPPYESPECLRADVNVSTR